MRLRATGSVLLLATLLAGCVNAGSTSASGDGRALQDAIERTLAADSFHVEFEALQGDDSVRGFIDYATPNRFHLVGEGPDGTDTIIIGKDHYLAVGPRFSHFRDACVATAEMVMPSLGALTLAEDVRFEDGIYRFSMPYVTAEPAEGEARVEDGLLVHVSITDSNDPSKPVGERYTISGFGSPITIQRPASDLVDEGEFAAPGLISVSPEPPYSCPSGG